MELEQDIELAIRERGLRQMLIREETRIRQAGQRRKVRIWALGGGGMLAVAAVLMLVFTIVPVARQMQQYSMQYVANIETGAYRGGDELISMLSDAMDKMKLNQWREAEAIADDLLAQTADSEDEYECDIRQSAEWIKALCLMHDGKVLRARRLLRHIAASDSYYSELAQELLDKR